MRPGSGLLIVVSSLAFAGACATRFYPPVDGELPGSPPDAEASDAGGPSFCRGAQALAGFTPDADTPYVTLDDGSGHGCVFTLGDALADPATCGAAQLTGYTEPDCPFTTVDFNVWSDPFFMTELGVQGAYAWMERSGTLQNGRVLELVIDSATTRLKRGHFRLGFDVSFGYDAFNASGTFALCTTPETSVDPCRQPGPPTP
jgi:hypothetical protein